MIDFKVVEFLEEIDNSELSECTKILYKQTISKLAIDVKNLDNFEEVMDWAILNIVKKHNQRYRSIVLSFFKKQFPKELYDKLALSLPKTNNIPRVHNRKELSLEKKLEITKSMEFEKHRLISKLMIFTGLRCVDVFHIKRTNIDKEENGSVKIKTVGKGAKDIIVFIHDNKLIEELYDFMNRTDYGSEYLFIQFHFGTKEVKNRKAVAFNTNILRAPEKRYIKVIYPSEFINMPTGSIIDLLKVCVGMDVTKIEEEFKEAFESGSIVWHELNQVYIKNLHLIINNNYQEFYNDLKMAMNMCGVPFTDWAAHDYRRGYASHVWKTTKDINVLKRQLNHSRVETSLRYLEQSGLDKFDETKKLQDALVNPLQPV